MAGDSVESLRSVVQLNNVHFSFLLTYIAENQDSYVKKPAKWVTIMVFLQDIRRMEDTKQLSGSVELVDKNPLITQQCPIYSPTWALIH